MERTVRHITEKMTAQLPRFREYYTPDDLQVLDIPSFIIERIILEMHQNLSESVHPPETEWANMEGDSVRFAWKNFLEAIKAEVRMPASFAAPLFETAVADALELATQPRKAIPDILYGNEAVLTVGQLKRRLRYVTVGRSLAAALVRYMEKKGKQDLKLDECKSIISKVDDKLVASYNTLDWAKELEPLFVLAGPSVDTDLFRLYFEDKERKKLANVFDKLNKSLNRTEFIEVMSSPDQILMDEDMEDEGAESKSEEIEESEVLSEKKSVANDPEIEEEEVPDDSILSAFQLRRGELPDDEEHATSEPEEMDEDSEEEALHSRFRFDREEDEAEDESGTIYKELRLEKSSSEDDELSGKSGKNLDEDLLSKWRAIGGDDEEADADEEPKENEKKKKPASKSTSSPEADDLAETDRPEDDEEIGVESIELYNETDDEEDVPIWRAFLEREDLSSVKEDDNESEKEISAPKEEVADKLSERFFGMYDDTDMSDEELFQKLMNQISDERERFVSGIFSGSERAYEEAVENIAILDDWKSASKFIKDEIFNRNHIDIFDEVAVDFTDRLHTFFKENKS
ncbi:hypothetical protein [Rhodohalobacter halophilus]|uniref:hypothetical protein n=1 Tax=Rhodohalobacter halophilus TaxID=1812810 RepID=UPI00083FA8EA|nr:hypothetical protein [Rhodohalobacter halophilus]